VSKIKIIFDIIVLHMDDIQLIIYLAFLGLYFLTRALSKRKKSKARPARRQTSEKTSTSPVSFEDLLRDFVGDDKKKQPKEEIIEPEIETVPEFEGDYPSDDEIDEVYKKSVSEAQRFKPLDKTIEIAPVSTKFKGYREEIEENTLADEVREMFGNLDDARKAIVLKEILDRKY